MTLRTLRDNARLGEPVTVITTIATVFASLLKIFGGNNPGHYDATGRFVPGDYQNRLAFLAEWLHRYGLTEYDIDQNLVDSYIREPSGWQGMVSGYVQQLAAEKQQNPNEFYPHKKRTTVPGGTGTGTTGANLFGGDITTILLIGAAAYIFLTMSKGKKRR